ncbi:MAG: tetratricopeptide repeat protein [Chloroflexi bacterium]|nr:tetratricopeptide repeat protein [Chloroflexota bacterium]
MFELEFWKDLGNIFDAVMNYQKKNVEFNNHFINPWIRLGNVFERQDQANDAIQAYARAAEIDPNATQNWINLGDAQFKQGAFSEANEAYRKAVILDPEAGWPLGNLAMSLTSQGNTEEAIPLYKRSIELLTDIKDKAICWNRLGNAYRKLNDYENAFIAFQTADQLDGENTGFNDNLDETPPTLSVGAPEEILEQMMVDQSTEIESSITSEISTLEVKLTPETNDEASAEIDVAVSSEASVQETEAIALEVETPVTDEVATLENFEVAAVELINEAEPEAEIPAVTEVSEDNAPAVSQEDNLAALQIIENVIAKVELDSLAQESPVEIESPIVSEGSAQEVVSIAETTEEIAAEVVLDVNNEAALDVEQPIAPIANEEAIQAFETIAAINENITLEAETLVNSEADTKENIETVTAELNEEAKSDTEAPVAIEASQAEPTDEDAPRRIPAWLVVPDAMKTEVQQELSQVESVTTLSEISLDISVSELVGNKDVVETFTAPFEVQLAEESTQTENQNEAGVETPEMISEDESNSAEEAPIVVGFQEANELAYEEYLKDVVEPTNILTTNVDEIQSEAPITKVSKSGELRIEMDTKNAHVWNELGNVYMNAGARDDAIASYSKAIELDRQFAWPYSNLALAYVQKGRFAEAILLYQRGIELFTSEKDKAVTWNRLGNVYRRINDYDNAIASYQTADELDPENATLSLRSSFGLLGNMYSDSRPVYSA